MNFRFPLRNPPLGPFSALLLACLIGDALAQSPLQAQEDVRRQTQDVREAIAGVLEELNSVGVDAPTLVVAKKMLVELETAAEKEMSEAIRLIQERGDSGSLLQAVSIQGKTSQRLLRLADLLEARQSFEGLGSRLRGLLVRQTENRQRTELLGASTGGGKTMRNRREEVRQLALGQQELIAEELAGFAQELPRYVESLTGESRRRAEEILKIYTLTRPTEAALEAVQNLENGNTPDSAKLQAAVQKSLGDMLALAGGGTGTDLSRAAAQLAELAGRQAALADATATASGREKADDLAAQQAEIARETEMLRQAMDTSNGQASSPASEALAAMQVAREALSQKKPDFAESANQQVAAAQFLEAAAKAAGEQAAAASQAPARNEAAELAQLAHAAAEIASAQAAAESTLQPKNPASSPGERANSQPQAGDPPSASSPAQAAADQRASAAEQLAEAVAAYAPNAAANLAEAAAQIRDNQPAAAALTQAANQLAAAATEAASAQQAAQAAASASQAIQKAQEQTAEAQQAMSSGQQNASAEAASKLSGAAQAIARAASAPGLPQESAQSMQTAAQALQQAARQAGLNQPTAPQSAQNAASALAAAERQLAEAAGQTPSGQTAGGPPPPDGQPPRPPVPGSEGGSGTGGQGTGIAEAGQQGALSEIPGFDPGTTVPKVGLDATGLSAHQRAALAALQRETTPPDYAPATRQYFRNLAGQSE